LETPIYLLLGGATATKKNPRNIVSLGDTPRVEKSATTATGSVADKTSGENSEGHRTLRKKKNTAGYCTLQGINISHLEKRKIIFKMPFLGDMLVPWRVMIIMI